MSKVYKSTERIIDVLLDINETPSSVETLSKRYGVTKKIIYEYLEWIKVRIVTFEKTEKKYSVKLNDIEKELLQNLRHPKYFEVYNTSNSPFTFNKHEIPGIVILEVYKGYTIPNQSYSHNKYSSILDELYHISLI